MAQAFRTGVPLPTIASGYGMSQEWAMKLIQEQLGLEAVRDVQEQHRVGYIITCEMCHEPIADDDWTEYVNDNRVHHYCLMEVL
jgi:hypothetical protein